MAWKSFWEKTTCRLLKVPLCFSRREDGGWSTDAPRPAVLGKGSSHILSSIFLLRMNCGHLQGGSERTCCHPGTRCWQSPQSPGKPWTLWAVLRAHIASELWLQRLTLITAHILMTQEPHTFIMYIFQSCHSYKNIYLAWPLPGAFAGVHGSQPESAKVPEFSLTFSKNYHKRLLHLATGPQFISML
jgi:hypothetical protein